MDQVAELIERCRTEDDDTQVDLIVQLEDAVLTPGAEDDTDLRHNALSSVKEAGHGERTVELLRQLTGDPELGSAAARTLREWT